MRSLSSATASQHEVGDVSVRPNAEGQLRPTPRTLEDLKKLNPRTAAVILGGALARRRAKDAKLRSQRPNDGDAGTADGGPATLTKEAL